MWHIHTGYKVSENGVAWALKIVFVWFGFSSLGHMTLLYPSLILRCWRGALDENYRFCKLFVLWFCCYYFQLWFRRYKYNIKNHIIQKVINLFQHDDILLPVIREHLETSFQTFVNISTLTPHMDEGDCVCLLEIICLKVTYDCYLNKEYDFEYSYYFPHLRLLL